MKVTIKLQRIFWNIHSLSAVPRGLSRRILKNLKTFVNMVIADISSELYKKKSSLKSPSKDVQFLKHPCRILKDLKNVEEFHWSKGSFTVTRTEEEMAMLIGHDGETLSDVISTLRSWRWSYWWPQLLTPATQSSVTEEGDVSILFFTLKKKMADYFNHIFLYLCQMRSDGYFSKQFCFSNGLVPIWFWNINRILTGSNRIWNKV